MKIAFLSRYQNNPRGVEVFVEELSHRLSRKHTVQIFSGKDADSLQKVIQGKFDIVVPTNGRLQSLKFSLARFLAGYKTLISGHSGTGRDDLWNLIICRPNAFVALTSVMENWAKRWSYGVPIFKIPNGVDLIKFNPHGPKIKIDLPRPVILSVGALTWYKHHEYAIEAVSKLKTGSLLIVGSGPLEDELTKKAEKVLPGRFKIQKFHYSDMSKLYRSVDLFTLPSWEREAFGIVYLEAMASNLPVIAPDDKSRREIIGEAGLFTDVSNSQSYAGKLEEALVTNWSNKPRTQAEKFDWEVISQQYEQTFYKLISVK